jgi:lipoate-protein ligase A
VGPLRQQTSLPRQTIIDHMVNHFAATFGLEDDELMPDEIAEAEARVAERFGTREWIYYLP